MLTPRILSNLKIFSEISLGCGFSSGGKTNVIKILNSENKYLYGSLVETQKQRRRKITKVSLAVDNESEVRDITDEKPIETITENPVQDNPRNRLSEKESNKTRIKRSKASTKLSNAVETTTVANTNETVTELSSDQFIFKSSVPISEERFPIINSDKRQLFSHDCVLKNVYNYTFTDPAVKRWMKLPSVSKIIEDTMSDKNKQILERWRQNMIKELGEEGFYKQNEASKARGQEFHAAVLQKVLGQEVTECSEITTNALHSLSWMLDEVSHPMAVESVIAHPRLGYKGVFDCVALFRNIPVLIDWKLSDKPKKDLKDMYDAPVQITAYIGALNHDPNYKRGVDHGLVAVAYTSGEPGDVFLLAPKHCHIYWRHWLLRLEKFKARSHLHLDHEIDEKALQLL